MNERPGIDEIRRARERLAGVARVTPLYPSETLSRLADRPVLLKAENLQRTGAFKIRGAYNTVAQLSDEERGGDQPAVVPRIWGEVANWPVLASTAARSRADALSSSSLEWRSRRR